RQIDALVFAARKGLRQPHESDVTEPALHKPLHPLTNLRQNAPGHLLFKTREFKLIEEALRIERRELYDFTDVVTTDFHVERLLSKAVAVAGGASRVPSEASVEDAVVHLVIVLLEEIEKAPDADVITRAVPDEVLSVRGEVLVGRVDVYAPIRRQFDQVAEMLAPLLGSEGRDGSLPDGEALIRDDEIRVQSRYAAEPLAYRTCTGGTVEGEHEGRRLLEADAVPLEVLAEMQRGTAAHPHDASAAALPKRLFHGVGNAGKIGSISHPHGQAIDQHEQPLPCIVAQLRRLLFVQVEDLLFGSALLLALSG